MGIPYSKQINAAFNQVTPLVASAYEVLETTKNIALFITAIQIGIITLLFFNLLALLGLLLSLNPDLEEERRTIVTPAMKWIAGCIMAVVGRKFSVLGGLIALLAAGSFAYLFYAYWMRRTAEEMAEDYVGGDDGLREREENAKGGEKEGGKDAKDEESK